MSPERLTPIEIKELREELHREFDKLSRLEFGGGNGFEKRTNNIVKEATLMLEDEVVRLDHQVDAGLGLVEDGLEPAGA